MPQAAGPTDTLPPSYPHDVRAVVLGVRDGRLMALLRQTDGDDRWALPGGGLRVDERLREAVAGHLRAQVGLKNPTYVEQIATHSAVDRDPRGRVLATAYLVLTETAADPRPASGAAWHPIDELPAMVLDHEIFVEAGVARLRAKLSYTNIGFALAPARFTMAELRDIVSAALGYEVSATNLNRVLTRRGVIEPSSEQASPGRTGGRPARLFSFTSRELTITDPFAVLKPTDRS